MIKAISAAAIIGLLLGGCSGTLKDLTGPCGLDLSCDPDDPATWPLPPLKLLGKGLADIVSTAIEDVI